MLSVFKLVSCKPGASRELDLRPRPGPGHEKLQMLSINLWYNIIVDLKGQI